MRKSQSLPIKPPFCNEPGTHQVCKQQRNSPVVFKIVRETIQVLQRAEARIKTTTKTGATDPDLFLLKNLLILKNELVSLEIGDVRDGQQDRAGMQYFGQIWNTTLSPGSIVGYVSSFLPGAAASLWSRGAAAVLPATQADHGGGGSGTQDASEQLDDLLRRAIGGFTQRWAALLSDARARKTGGKNIVKIEADLEDMLQCAFSNQPEVIGKLKEAIHLHQQALNQKR